MCAKQAAKQADDPGPKKANDRTPVKRAQLKKEKWMSAKGRRARRKERPPRTHDGGSRGKREDGRLPKPVPEAEPDSPPPESSQLSVLVALQRCRAVRWKPCPVVAISVCPDQSAVAVARESGTIELWDCSTWALILSLPGKADACITALCWIWDTITDMWRLFSCGLDTLIVEWHLRHQSPLHVTSTLGGAAWHMAAQPQHLPEPSDDTSEAADPLVAVATDDGAVRLHAVQVGTPGMQLLKALAHADARALHVLWRDDGAVLYAAFSNGCISVLEVSTGAETLRITAATQSGGQPACIWSLAALPGGLLASASSKGVVQTFETQFGTQLSTCHHHQADVTCLAASACGRHLFAAGVDPSIVLMSPSQAAGVAAGAPARFQFADRRRPHTRDVRAMGVVRPSVRGQARPALGHSSPSEHPEDSPSWLLTGGNDAQLLVHSAERFQQVHSARVTAAPCAPLLAFSASGRFIAADRAAVDVWQPAVAPRTQQQGKPVAQEGERLPAQQPPCLIARIGMEPDQVPVAAAVSACGQLLAWATAEGTTLLGISEVPRRDGGTDRSIAAVRLQEPLPAACCLCFLQSSQEDEGEQGGCWLMLGCMDGRLLCLCVDVTCESKLGPPVPVPLPAEVTLQKVAAMQLGAAPASQQLQPAFTHTAVSPCGRSVAVVTPHAVHILCLQHEGLEGGRLVAAGKLSMPHSPSVRPITAVSLGLSGNVVAIATTDVQLELYDSRTLMQLDWLHNAAGLSAKLDMLNGHVYNLCFRPSVDPSDKGSLMLCSRTHVCHVCLDSVAAGVPLTGAGIMNPPRHRGKLSIVADRAGNVVRVIDSRGVVLGAQWVSPDCFMLVQGSWDDVSDSLPPPLMLKLYGR